MSHRHEAITPYVLAVICLISCSMLMYEILLMRISALRLFFHFGFLVISNCLLGIGASGTLISVTQDFWKKRPRLWITVFCALYIISLALTYAFLLNLPVPDKLTLANWAHLAQFLIYNLVAIPPFIFAGMVVGLILMLHADRVNVVYFSDLTGAGLGCMLSPLLLWRYGAGGCFLFLLLLALVAVIVAVPARRARLVAPAGIVLILIGLWLLPRFDQKFPVPGKGELDFTDKVRMNLPVYPEYSRWSSNSRIDLVDWTGNPLIFWLGENRADLPPPPDGKVILQDGAAGTFIMDFSDNPRALETIRRSLYSTALQLKQNPRTFIIGVGGGNDVWAAKINNASYIKGIELNRPILDIHHGVLSNFSRNLLDDPTIELVCAEGRSALMRETEPYDIIQMSGVDTWTALSSGSYVMAEDYLYTREAIQSMYSHLAQDGILQCIRYAGPAESLRLISNIHAAFQAMGVPDFERSIICIRNSNLMCVLVKRGVFTAEEVSRVASFVRRGGLSMVYLPHMQLGTLAEVFIRTPDKNSFIDQCKEDISPTTDDSPYFFFFSRWGNPFRTNQYRWKPGTVFSVNPNFILLQLLFSGFLSVALIVAPLVVFAKQRVDRRWAPHALVYFAGLGFGFIGVEIVAMQKFTLFLGHPVYSITVTLFSILIFTGIGSLVSANWFRPPDKRIWLVAGALVLLVALFILFTPWLVSAAIHLPLLTRIAITAAVLAPVCLLLGVPFAYGIRLLNLKNPSLIPWAWAVNGCSTVMGSILTMILSMNFGFNAVLVIAVLTYLAAFTAINHVE